MSYTRNEVVDIYQEMFNSLGYAPRAEHYEARFSTEELEGMVKAMGIKELYSNSLPAAITIAVVKELRTRNGDKEYAGAMDWHRNLDLKAKKLIISDSELEAKLKRELEDSKSKALEEEFAEEAEELEELEEDEEEVAEVEWWK